jgi:hypothetical protein
MGGTGTYFKQVPKAVIEKIVARQIPPAECDLVAEEAVKKRAARKAKTRHPKS